MSLHDQIQETRAATRSGAFANEAAVSQGIVLPLLQALGWPVFRPQIVAPEYSVGTRRVDFALCDPPGRPMVFVEVKQAGNTDGADRQLFEYAFHEGVPMAVLTDGQEWGFYLPAEQGRYDERRVYKLDLIEREVDECVRRLKRYLAYEAVRSGEAIDRARHDYRDVRRQRQIEATLPQAWAKLLTEPDELLVELVADQVESLCGYEPELDAVTRFLSRISTQPPDSRPKLPTTQKPQPPSTLPPPRRNHRRREYRYHLDGRTVRVRTAREVLIRVFTDLAERDSTFLERFAGLPKHGSKRRYLARRREDLYPDRPDLMRLYSVELQPGWWIGTNVGTSQVERILRMACDVARLRFGKDLEVEFD